VLVRNCLSFCVHYPSKERADPHIDGTEADGALAGFGMTGGLYHGGYIPSAGAGQHARWVRQRAMISVVRGVSTVVPVRVSAECMGPQQLQQAAELVGQTFGAEVRS
jgi:hypothetical protein